MAVPDHTFELFKKTLASGASRHGRRSRVRSAFAAPPGPRSALTPANVWPGQRHLADVTRQPLLGAAQEHDQTIEAGHGQDRQGHKRPAPAGPSIDHARPLGVRRLAASASQDRNAVMARMMLSRRIEAAPSRTPTDAAASRPARSTCCSSPKPISTRSLSAGTPLRANASDGEPPPRTSPRRR